MVKVTAGSKEVETFERLDREIMEARPDAQKLWNATRAQREIVLALVRMRKEANLTQAELAEKTGWDTGYISRLESAAGGIPHLGTIARYTQACGQVFGLTFGFASPECLHILEAVTLPSPGPAIGFELLRNMDVAISDDMPTLLPARIINAGE